MITQAERRFIWEHAYVPEHVPEYVCAISGAEAAYLTDDFLFYMGDGGLIFVGYPLKDSSSTKACEKCFRRALKRYRPERVNVIGPHVPAGIPDSASVSHDHYFRLEIEHLKIPQKVRNMIARASKEVAVIRRRNFGEEHAALIDEFRMHHAVGEATRSIFERIPEYLQASETAVVFEARDSDGKLIAFDVAESGAEEYLFYLFNFSSSQRYTPGVSDLLAQEMIGEATAKAKKYINLGLGIDPGVTFFKTKWGGHPFLPYVWCEYTIPRAESVRTLLDKL